MAVFLTGTYFPTCLRLTVKVALFPDRGRLFTRSFSTFLSTKQFVDEQINSHKVVVFGRSDCEFSCQAKATLEAFNLKPGAMGYTNIDERSDFLDVKDYLKLLTGAGTTPRVFIGQKFFGGGDDTVAAAKDGRLATHLEEVGAI
ncbi:Glutaredoxin-1 [Trichostrongylus colubriformis]|uniref:Glutaredoxin-1 n=1 Tax=Trichostrongylus colubriformis TaxID=6319 RepID=A0AAN8FUG6_TRICO